MPTNHFRPSSASFASYCLFALWSIFRSGNLSSSPSEAGHRHGGWHQPALRDQAAGGRAGISGTPLSEAVMDALKKRVDPDGVRNLIWRPQGNTRLEIQMPTIRRVRREQGQARCLCGRAAGAGRRPTYPPPPRCRRPSKISPASGKERDTRLASLAMGDPARTQLFAELVKALTTPSASAHTARNAAA